MVLYVTKMLSALSVSSDTMAPLIPSLKHSDFYVDGCSFISLSCQTRHVQLENEFPTTRNSLKKSPT